LSNKLKYHQRRLTTIYCWKAVENKQPVAKK